MSSVFTMSREQAESLFEEKQISLTETFGFEFQGKRCSALYDMDRKIYQFLIFSLQSHIDNIVHENRYEKVEKKNISAIAYGGDTGVSSVLATAWCFYENGAPVKFDYFIVEMDIHNRDNPDLLNVINADNIHQWHIKYEDLVAFFAKGN